MGKAIAVAMANFKCEGCDKKFEWPEGAQPFHLKEKGVCHNCNKPYTAKPCRKKGSIHPIMYKSRCDWQRCSFCGTDVYGHNAHTLARCAEYLRDELERANQQLEHYRKSDSDRLTEVLWLRRNIDKAVGVLRSHSRGD